MRKLFILFILAVVGFSCSNSSTSCDQLPEGFPSVQLDITPLHDQILGVESEEALLTLLEEAPVAADVFLQRGNYPNDSIMAQALFSRFSNPHIDTLQQEIKEVFGELEVLTKELNSAFAWLSYYYPNTRLPKIKTVATGFENGADLYVSDSLIIIGLDYYLGEGATYRPLGFPAYILKKYSQEFIVPSIMLLYGISPTYNHSDLKDKTMLTEMITYGKAYYFAKSMLPCVADSTIIGYSAEEFNGSVANMPIIWAHFLDNELLYSQENFTKKKYLGERPKTYEIGDKCPGRIGAWLGWAIVSEFDKRKELTLKELMETPDAQQIFQESRFRPGK